MAQNYPKGAQGATQPARPHKRSSGALVRIRPIDPPPISATALDAPRFCGIPYADRYFYFDSLYFQSKTLLGMEDQWWLEQHSDRFEILWDGQVVFDRHKRKRTILVYPPYRIQIEIHCPDLEAQEFLARICARSDRRLIAVHPARDFTFDHRRNDKQTMLDFFNERWVQPYQRKDRDVVRFDNGQSDNGGGSTGRRAKGHFETHYASEPCRIDGIVECFHIEDRILGKQALSKAGINTPMDLLDFDHEAFWRNRDRESLRAIGLQRLGQYHRNRQRGSRSRRSINDKRIGGTLIRALGLDEHGSLCTQKFIQKYGRGPFLRNAHEPGLLEEKMQTSGIDITREAKP